MLTVSRLKVAPVFRMNLRPKPDTPNLLLTLPPELRNRIYELTVFDNYTSRLTSVSWPWKEAPILRIQCKQIEDEAACIYYGSVNVSFTASLLEEKWAMFLQNLRAIVHTCGQHPFKGFHIVIMGQVWERLDNLLPLLEFMRSSGFEPACATYQERRDRPGSYGNRIHSPSSVFSTTTYASGNAQFVLEKALSLARRARVEEWSAERLAKSFAIFVKVQKKEKGKKARIFVDLKAL